MFTCQVRRSKLLSECLFYHTVPPSLLPSAEDHGLLDMLHLLHSRGEQQSTPGKEFHIVVIMGRAHQYPIHALQDSSQCLLVEWDVSMLRKCHGRFAQQGLCLGTLSHYMQA